MLVYPLVIASPSVYLAEGFVLDIRVEKIQMGDTEVPVVFPNPKSLAKRTRSVSNGIPWNTRPNYNVENDVQTVDGLGPNCSFHCEFHGFNPSTPEIASESVRFRWHQLPRRSLGHEPRGPKSQDAGGAREKPHSEHSEDRSGDSAMRHWDAKVESDLDWLARHCKFVKGSLVGETSVLRTFRMSGKELVKERVSQRKR